MLKKAIFWSIALCIPPVILVIGEAGLRLFDYGYPQKPYLSPTKIHSDKIQKTKDRYYMVNPYLYQRYSQPRLLRLTRYAKFKKYWLSFPRNFFRRQKPDDTLRIFVLGGSTAAGQPYTYGLRWSELLRNMLEDSSSVNPVEMVNFAGAAFTTQAVRDILRQIKKHDPDAILLYTGQNDREMAPSLLPISVSLYLHNLNLKLLDFKLYSFLQENVLSLQNTIADYFDAFKKLFGVYSESPRGNKRSISQARSLYHFKHNLRHVLKSCRKNNIPVFVSSLVNNTEKWPLPKKFNRLIRDLTNTSNVHYVPTLEYFRKKTSSPKLEWNLFIDSVHPNKYGQLQLAKAFYNSLAESKYFSSTIDTETRKPWNHYKQRMNFSELPDQFAKHAVWTVMREPIPYFNNGIFPRNYPQIYKPRSVSDGLAFKIFHRDLSLRKAFVQLSNYHVSRGNLNKALDINRHLRRQEFWNPKWHRNTTRILKDMREDY